MNRHTNKSHTLKSLLLILISALTIISLTAFIVVVVRPGFSTESSQVLLPSVTAQAEAMLPSATPLPANTSTNTPTPLVTATPSSTSTPSRTPTATSTATATSTPTITPTPTLDLSQCHALGCNLDVPPPPTADYRANLLVIKSPPQRTQCDSCPQNETLSDAELDTLVSADSETIAQLQALARSQETYEIAPGLVYLVFENVHHVVVDLKESGFTLRNIIPPIPDLETQEQIRITPSYCMRPESLVITDADYHGLVGSNKTEEGRELFFHLGRAALFLRPNSFGDPRYGIDVMTEYEDFHRALVSWGGGPIFIFNGRYDFNPKEEWFEAEQLDRYQTKLLPKMTVAISRDRKYLFLSASNGLTLEEHAENILALGENWGIIISSAMRFDGNESTYMAIRMGETMVPVLNLKEPLIVNCFAIEKSDE